MRGRFNRRQAAHRLDRADKNHRARQMMEPRRSEQLAYCASLVIMCGMMSRNAVATLSRCAIGIVNAVRAHGRVKSRMRIIALVQIPPKPAQADAHGEEQAETDETIRHESAHAIAQPLHSRPTLDTSLHRRHRSIASFVEAFNRPRPINSTHGMRTLR
jgi:hypothetical protein